MSFPLIRVVLPEYVKGINASAWEAQANSYDQKRVFSRFI